MTLPLLLTAILSTVSDAGHPSAEPSVVRVYDLSTALPGSMSRGGTETLMPFLSGNRHYDADEGYPLEGADAAIDLLRSLSGDQFDYEARSIQLEESGRLVVRAPAALQAKTAEFLGFLETVFGASVELRVDAVELPDGPAAEAVPALLAPAEADKLLARGGPGGVRSWRLRIRAGDTAGIDLTRTASLVTDYDIEIAQASSIADPIVEEVPVGVRLFARAAPSAGGLWLSLVLRRGDPLGEVVDRSIPLSNSVTTQERILGNLVAHKYQRVDVLNRSLALDTFLPESRVLAIQTSVLSDSKTRSEILLVRRESGSLPIFQQIALDTKGEAGGGRVLFLNGESIVPTRCSVWGAAIPAFAVPSVLRMSRANEDVGLWASFGENTIDVLRDVLGSQDPEIEVRNVGPCIFLSRNAGSPKREAPLLPSADGKGIEFLERYAPPARIAQVTATLKRVGAPAPVARCSIPVRFGESGWVVLGTEAVELADYDVEVAQSASVADAVMRYGFDGIALRVRPALALSGDLVIDLAARAHVRRGGARKLELEVDTLGAIDESTHDQLFAREKLVFRKAEGSPKRFVLGQSGESAGADSLLLEVEAVELGAPAPR